MDNDANVKGVWRQGWGTARGGLFTTWAVLISPSSSLAFSPSSRPRLFVSRLVASSPASLPDFLGRQIPISSFQGRVSSLPLFLFVRFSEVYCPGFFEWFERSREGTPADRLPPWVNPSFKVFSLILFQHCLTCSSVGGRSGRKDERLCLF